MMKPAIALFARAPVPGAVKTRLIGRHSAEQVAELYRAFVLDIWEMLAQVGSAAELFLYTDRECAEWGELAGDYARPQRGANLGDRMLHCWDEMQRAGFRPLLILGSDSPALTLASVAPWTELLETAASVLGPAEDGGYYAIGCRQPHPQMFDGVEWSSPRTLAQTAAALDRWGMPPAYLATHYDIDTPDDLVRLAREPHLGRHTREWLLQHTPVI